MPAKKDNSIDRVELKLDLFKEHFDKHMESVAAHLGKVDDRLDRIDTTAATNTAVLEEHVRRTNLLEEKIELDKKDIEGKLEPIKAHVNQVKIFMKIAGLVVGGGSILGGAGVGIKKLIEAIFGG